MKDLASEHEAVCNCVCSVHTFHTLYSQCATRHFCWHVLAFLFENIGGSPLWGRTGPKGMNSLPLLTYSEHELGMYLSHKLSGEEETQSSWYKVIGIKGRHSLGCR